ncbi:MAG: dipeptidase [Sedimentisphaerales bacterium]|nr:dipeptidase [Sedimentisphaerales bacterium]
MPQTPQQYITQNQPQFLDQLQQFLRFPSISAQPVHQPDIQACAQWLIDHFIALGLQTQLIQTKGHPIVSAQTNFPTNRKVIIYGHYDVQPEDPIDQWQTPPFEPTIKNGFLYARGASDDKGQLFAHIKAVEALLKTNTSLPCNVHFLIEGEEESTGNSLEHYITQNASQLACDAVLISDTTMFNETTPAVTYALRGLAGFEVTVKGPNRDLHSGAFGGAVANPALILSHILSQCITTTGKILIPGFYDSVLPLSANELQTVYQLPFDEAQFAQSIGIPQTSGESEFPVIARIGHRPTFEVNGMFSGYTGPGGKTIIPASATAKITMRLVPDQDWNTIAQLADNYIRSLAPDTVHLEISPHFGANPILIDTHHPIMQTARNALRLAFDHTPVFIREGGSIPVVNTFAQTLKVPVVLIGLGLASDNIHSPNENFKIENFIKGAQASAQFLTNL